MLVLKNRIIFGISFFSIVFGVTPVQSQNSLVISESNSNISVLDSIFPADFLEKKLQDGNYVLFIKPDFFLDHSSINKFSLIGARVEPYNYSFDDKVMLRNKYFKNIFDKNWYTLKLESVNMSDNEITIVYLFSLVEKTIGKYKIMYTTIEESRFFFRFSTETDSLILKDYYYSKSHSDFWLGLD